MASEGREKAGLDVGKDGRKEADESSDTGTAEEMRARESKGEMEDEEDGDGLKGGFVAVERSASSAGFSAVGLSAVSALAQAVAGGASGVSGRAGEAAL